MQKNDAWQPTASIITLKQRAKLIQEIREFFYQRAVLEVETPLLCHTSVTDPHLTSFTTNHGTFLQTSPEYAMKRLLAAGSGDIFQLTKAFRAEEFGQHHNQEFTLLEWYRLGFDQLQLINEVDELLQQILHCHPAEKITYQQLFEQQLGINPHAASINELIAIAKQHQLDQLNLSNKDDWLNLLLSHVIEPTIGQHQPIFIYDYPASQAALAKIRHDQPPVAERFECYFQGIELANGFHELTDHQQQRQRFIANNQHRQQSNKPSVPIDEYFLDALAHGLPNCAGVALGVDRLVMLALNENHIANVLSFTQENA